MKTMIISVLLLATVAMAKLPDIDDFIQYRENYYKIYRLRIHTDAGQNYFSIWAYQRIKTDKGHALLPFEIKLHEDLIGNRLVWQDSTDTWKYYTLKEWEQIDGKREN